MAVRRQRTAEGGPPVMRAGVSVAGLLAALGLAACGGPSSTSSTTTMGAPPTSTGSPTSAPASSPTPLTGDAGDPQLLPLPTDTPYAQAPAAIKAEWQSYFARGIISTVPNSTVPYQRPTTPRVQNATRGAVDDATAQRWGDALMRQTAWATWAIDHNQLQLLYETSSRNAYPGIALPAGASGFQIVGNQYALTLRLARVPAATQQILRVSDSYAFIATASAGSINAVFPDGHTQPLPGQTTANGTTYFITGALATKPLLGDVWFGTSSAACDSGEPPPIQTMCNT